MTDTSPKSRLSHGVGEDGVAWGVTAESRVNTFLARLMLKSLQPRRIPIRPLRRLYFRLRGLPGLVLGCDIRTANIGDDLYLPHPYGIVVNANCVIGDGCTIFHRVTLGELGNRPGVPMIGNNVLIGANATILGDVTIGDGATIGAGAIVLEDVPPGGVAVGHRARVLGPKPEDDSAASS